MANVSLAIQQWLTLNVTPEGQVWYEARGRRLLDSIAAFWASRVDFCSEKGAYVIRGEEGQSGCATFNLSNGRAAQMLVIS